jgi:hypothetical protein
MEILDAKYEKADLRAPGTFDRPFWGPTIAYPKQRQRQQFVLVNMSPQGSN